MFWEKHDCEVWKATSCSILLSATDLLIHRSFSNDRNDKKKTLKFSLLLLFRQMTKTKYIT